MYGLLAVVIFLLGIIAGTVVLSYLSNERSSELLLQALSHLAAEHRKHADATATVLLKERRIGMQAILKELRAAANERRELLRLASGDPDESDPTRVAFVDPANLPSIPPPPRLAHVDPDALTPPSGYPLVDLFKEEANR
ncbi:MAG: hypothetical protein U0441_00930 [Polyangiaceae bacterium]